MMEFLSICSSSSLLLRSYCNLLACALSLTGLSKLSLFLLPPNEVLNKAMSPVVEEPDKEPDDALPTRRPAEHN